MSKFAQLVLNLLIEQEPGETPVATPVTNNQTQVVGDGNKLVQDLYNSNNSSFTISVSNIFSTLPSKVVHAAGYGLRPLTKS